MLMCDLEDKIKKGEIYIQSTLVKVRKPLVLDHKILGCVSKNKEQQKTCPCVSEIIRKFCENDSWTLICAKLKFLSNLKHNS